MRIIIHSVATEILAQTISLAVDRSNPDNSYLFRCIRCGTPIARVKGLVTDIVPDLVTMLDVPVIHACYQCHESYVFQTIKSSRRRTNLILSPEPDKDSSIFRCFICRMPLVKYSPKIAVRLPEETLMTLPTNFTCPACERDYLLSDVVSL